jgi:hypothetical protein
MSRLALDHPFLPSQISKVNPYKTRKVSHDDVSLRYTLRDRGPPRKPVTKIRNPPPTVTRNEKARRATNSWCPPIASRRDAQREPARRPRKRVSEKPVSAASHHRRTANSTRPAPICQPRMMPAHGLRKPGNGHRCKRKFFVCIHRSSSSANSIREKFARRACALCSSRARWRWAWTYRPNARG